VTVCNYNKSIGDIPQGLPGASVSIEPKASSSLIYYFGTMLSNITNPLPNNLNSTSWDGGVLLENIPVNQNQLLTIRASKPGFEFSETLAACIWPGVFINGAPNQGPRVMNPSKK